MQTLSGVESTSVSYTHLDVYKRQDIGNDVVEVCTIHSFLYANVVKPYAGKASEEETDPDRSIEHSFDDKFIADGGVPYHSK